MSIPLSSVINIMVSLIFIDIIKDLMFKSLSKKFGKHFQKSMILKTSKIETLQHSYK